MPATAVKRGCGTRIKGGIYAETGLSEHGLPLEYFMVDPPIRVDPAALGLTAVGVTMIERGNTWHVLDWIGSQYYPNVADFIEEVRRFGMSRRLPKTLDFGKLTKFSKHILVHSRAWIGESWDYLVLEKEGTGKACPKRKSDHESEFCARLWWDDVDPIRQNDKELTGRRFTRRMPSFEYEASTRPESVADAKHAPAIFLALPIERLAVVRDPEGGTHEQAAEAAAKSGLRVTVEDE